MEKIIEIRNLDKSFADVHAVNNLSFSVRKGELFAFLGENGAGKSTTISIICGQLGMDKGEVLVASQNVKEHFDIVSRKIGVVFQNSVLDSALTVKNNLESRASLYGIFGKDFENRLVELSKLLDFENLLNRTVGKLSGGQRRRVDIARALIHKPEILILDEPTTGLDPQTRKLLWDVVSDLRKNDELTVFLTTHYMEEAADADYIVIIDKGSIVAEGTPNDLKNKYTKDFIYLYNHTEDEVKDLGLDYNVITHNKENIISISIENTEKARELIISHPDLFNDFEVTKGKMDDVFLNVTGKKLLEGNN